MVRDNKTIFLLTHGNYLGVSCIDPPAPPAEQHLVPNYISGTVVEVGENVSYICEPEHFFEDDYFQVNFNVTCDVNGTWIHPVPWPKCLSPLGLLSCLEFQV